MKASRHHLMIKEKLVQPGLVQQERLVQPRRVQASHKQQPASSSGYASDRLTEGSTTSAVPLQAHSRGTLTEHTDLSVEALREHTYQGSTHNVSRRQKQRLRKRIGQSLQDEQVEEALEILHNRDTRATETSEDLPESAPSQASAVRGKDSKGKGTDKASSGQKIKVDLSRSSRAVESKGRPTCLAALHASSMRALAQTWKTMKAEFQVQILVWESLPRTSAAGVLELGIAVEGSVEAHMLSSMQSILELGDVAPVSAAEFIHSASQQPLWDTGVLSIPLCRAIQALSEALLYHKRVVKIPSLALTTGRTVEAAVADGTLAEKLELDKLLKASLLSEQDLVTARHACGFNAEVVALVQPGSGRPGTSSGEQPRSPQPARTFTSEQSTLKSLGIRCRVKNSFLEYDDDVDSDFRSQASSHRSSSVPARCSPRSAADSDLDGPYP